MSSSEPASVSERENTVRVVALPPLPRKFPERIGITVIILLTLAYFFWTAVSSFDRIPWIRPQGHTETDHFNMLSHGFLKGHLYLDCEVPAELVNAPNPYDPANRARVEVLHDASYYKGKYYIYFGPIPVITLMLPFTVITGRDLPLPYGVLFFTSVGYLALVSAFLFIQRRHFPRASIVAIAASLLALGGASMLVALLRRPHIWEFPAAAGFCFFAVSLLCLTRALHSPQAVRWAVAGGVALGMAVASRPTYIVCSPLFALPLLLRTTPTYRWRALVGAAAGCTAIVLGLLAYNYARFGELFEFGQKYQLSAAIEGNIRHFGLDFVPFNLRVYFLSALRWAGSFPFHQGIVVPTSPPGHGGYEYTIGLLPNLPFVGFVLGGAASAFWFRRHAPDDGIRRSIVILLIAAAGLQTAMIVCYFGNCIRYMADFTPCLMLLASLGVLAGEDFLRPRIARIMWRALALVLALFSSFVSAMAIVSFYAPIPTVYQPIARVLNYPVHLLQRIRAPASHPVEITVTFPADSTPRQEPLVALTRDGQHREVLFVEYLGRGQLRFAFRGAGDRPPQYSPVVAPAPADRHTIRVSVNTRFADYDGRVFRMRVHFDGWLLWDVPAVSLDVYPGRFEVGAAGSNGTRFTGEVHATRAVHESVPERLGGARVRITLNPEMAGRSFPLLTTGEEGIGDLLFVQIGEQGNISFGYDHWADKLRLSPIVPARFHEEHVLEFWTPAVAALGGYPAKELVVKLDGTTVWRQPAPFFPTAPKSVFVGANPIGGTTCESVLIHGVIEQTQLAPPSP